MAVCVIVQLLNLNAVQASLNDSWLWILVLSESERTREQTQCERLCIEPLIDHVVCLKGPITAAFVSSEPFCLLIPR